MDTLEKQKEELGLMIDLTFTTRYYKLEVHTHTHTRPKLPTGPRYMGFWGLGHLAQGCLPVDCGLCGSNFSAGNKHHNPMQTPSPQSHTHTNFTKRFVKERHFNFILVYLTSENTLREKKTNNLIYNGAEGTVKLYIG